MGKSIAQLNPVNITLSGPKLSVDVTVFNLDHNLPEQFLEVGNMRVWILSGVILTGFNCITQHTTKI